MFSVDTRLMARVADDMSKQITKLRFEIDELERIKRVLPSLTVYKKEITAISKAITELREIRMKYMRYMKVLDEISAGYRTCENRVLNNVERLRTVQGSNSIGLVKLNGIRNVLNDVL